MKKPLLEIKNMNLHYGGIHAIQKISFHVNEGEIVTLLGANGAGKTSTLKAISSLKKITSGKILFQGESLSNLKGHQVVKKGISHSPEGRLIFPELTVFENLEMGAYLRKDNYKEDLSYMQSLFPILKERSKQKAGTLSGGEQQMLAISRAYMAKPKLLLLDEPSLGIAPILIKKIFLAIQKINSLGMTILLVEQNAFAALKIAHRGYVMSSGKITLEDTGEKLLNNDEVRNAYLGY
jgi:branched-chain amino acid transport system ATP-binding protein